MDIQESTVTKLYITGVPSLDPVSVYLEDFGPGRGKVTITCFDDSWTNAWGAMGEQYDMRRFFTSCDNDYLANKLSSGIKSEVESTEGIVEHVRREILKLRKLTDISKDSARTYWEEAINLDGVADSRELFDNHGEIMTAVFGDEWWYLLPTKPNHKYEYLCRIIITIKEALNHSAEKKVAA